jgi:hypothetical protein
LEEAYQQEMEAGRFDQAAAMGQAAVTVCRREAGYPGLVSHWCCLVAKAHLAKGGQESAAEALKVGT